MFSQRLEVRIQKWTIVSSGRQPTLTLALVMLQMNRNYVAVSFQLHSPRTALSSRRATSSPSSNARDRLLTSITTRDSTGVRSTLRPIRTSMVVVALLASPSEAPQRASIFLKLIVSPKSSHLANFLTWCSRLIIRAPSRTKLSTRMSLSASLNSKSRMTVVGPWSRRLSSLWSQFIFLWKYTQPSLRQARRRPSL